MPINPDHISTANFSSGAAQTVTSSTGNLSIVALWINTAGTITSITDNKGNTYVQGITSGTYNIWYAPGAATGITSITVNFTGGGTVETVFYDCSGAHPTNPLVNTDFTVSTATGSTATANPVGPISNYPYGGGIAISVIASNGGVTTAVASPFTLDAASNAGIAHNTFASPGVFAANWTTAGSGVWGGITAVFASSTGTSNLRFAKGKSDAHVTSLQTNQITIASGDLAIVFLTTDVGITATLSDGFANTYTPVTGMNPYVGTSGDYDIWAGFCVVSQTGQNAFSGSYTSDSGVCIYAIVITPATTPTINAHGVGTTSSANVNHIAATCSPAATDFLVALTTSGNPYLAASFTANGSWSLGAFEQDSNFYEAAAIEFQLSAAGGSTHDDMTTSSAVEANEVIFSFTISAPAVGYFLEDSGSTYWQLGITTLGQWNPTSIGPQTIVPLVLQDSTGVYWQLAITTSGEFNPSTVSPTTTTPIVLTDSQGQKWQAGVSPNGQWLPQLLTYVGFITYIGP